MRIIIYFSVLVLFYCQSCRVAEQKAETADAFENYRSKIAKTKIIGHKGSGPSPRYGYQGHRENSYPSLKNAIQKTAGTEMDIQISADSTLWVFHNHELYSCDSTLQNIALLLDDEIDRASDCNYSNELIRLDSLTVKLAKLNVTDKVISLDLKVLQNPEAIRLFKGEENLAEAVIRRSEKLNKLTGFKILVEVPTLEYLAYFERESPFEIYLLSRSQKELRNPIPEGYSADIRLFENENIKIDPDINLQLWVVNEIEPLLRAIEMQADYIQSDNISLASFVQKATSSRLEKKQLMEKSHYGTDSGLEYLDLREFTVEQEAQNLLIELSFDSCEGLDDSVLWVFSCSDRNGETVFWKAVPIHSGKVNYLRFIDFQKLRELNGEAMKSYIWNKNKVDFELHNLKIHRQFYPENTNGQSLK